MGKSLYDSVATLKGVGKETQEQLALMNIKSIADLFEYFPFRYEDYRLRDLQEVEHDEKITIEGKVHSQPSIVFYNRKRSRLTVNLLVEKYLVKAVFFNQAYLKNKFELNETVTVTGKWDKHRLTIAGQEVKFGAVARDVDFEPVYGVKGKVTVKLLRRLLHQGFHDYGQQLNEILPQKICEKYKLMDRRHALYSMHFPKDQQEVKLARRRFVYEEFLLFQLRMQLLRKQTKEASGGISQTYDLDKLKTFIQSLPFELTDAQKKVMNEICADLLSPHQMNRLLQGDVGSGKTIIAAIALYASVTAGYQGALMVPTEILAEQHANALNGFLEPMGLSVALLTSSVKGKRRKDLLAQLESGNIDILVGTHALIQEEVIFKHLGLVITDEQHRFGVNQRRLLRSKGQTPDVLFMTATPIPRTLAITAFGEMDVSIINELPKGRKPIQTYWAKEDMLERVLSFLQKEVAKGRQAYVICPLIEESEKLDVQNAVDVYNMLTDIFAQQASVGLMHGKLRPEDKDQVMKQFLANEVQILVSTTVVEVGVNVPNATMMVIYDAERFGLSQLHQLRGRVGRGEEQSYCILLADPKTEDGKERMKIMTETNDGFVLSEKDLELRGPGDFFGRKQSGLPEFKVADMVHDYNALETARQDADIMIHDESFWHSEQYEWLRTHTKRHLEGETKGKLD